MENTQVQFTEEMVQETAELMQDVVQNTEHTIELTTGGPVPSSFPVASDASVNANGTVIRPTKDDQKGASTSIFGFGKQAGQQVAAAAGQFQATVRGLLTSTAETLLGKPDEQDVWLKGYAEGLESKFKSSSIATMKSNAKKVFQAWAMSHTRTIGMDESTKEPIRVTKQGREWLMESEAKFQNWLDLARNIVDGHPEKREKKMPKKMSDVAVEKTGHLLAVASPNQAQSVAEQAVAKLTPTAAKVVAVKATEQMLKDKQKGWETELFTAIEGMANEILGHSQNSYYREIASDILSGVGELLTAASAAAALQNTPLANAPEKEIVAAAHATEATQ